MSDSQKHDEEHQSLGDKLKHPFHELKEKLKGTHLHDAKIHLIHEKCVQAMTEENCTSRVRLIPLLDIRSGNLPIL